MNKFVFNQIFCTKIGWLFISLIFTFIFGCLTNWFDWAIYGVYISLVYPVLLGLIMIVYAWIINPLKRD